MITQCVTALLLTFGFNASVYSVKLMRTPPVVTLFTKPQCSLCDTAKFLIQRAKVQVSFDFQSCDISAQGNEALFEKYKYDIPVVHLDGVEVFRHHISETDLISLIRNSQHHTHTQP